MKSNNISQEINTIQLVEYLHKNKNIDPFNKIMIAKNIALAYKKYQPIEFICGDFDPENCFINPETLLISIEGNHESEGIILDIDNRKQNVAYSAPERLNQSQDDNELAPLEPGAYAATAIIIDMLTGIFPPDLKSLNKIYKEYLEKHFNVNPNSHCRNQIKQKVIEHYFGKEFKNDDLNSHSIDTTLFCIASHVRINALMKEMSKEDYFLSYDTKQRLINVCKSMLVTNPNNRPSAAALLETLQNISLEFTKHYLNDTVNFITKTMSNLELQFPGITEKRLDEITALSQMVLELETKEFVTKKQIINLNQTIAYSLQLLAKGEQVATYSNNVSFLEEMINKSFDDDFVDISLTEEHHDDIIVQGSNKKELQHVAERLNQSIEILSKSNLEEVDFKLFKKRNTEVLNLLTETYKGRDFFASAIGKINKAMNNQPWAFQDNHFKK